MNLIVLYCPQGQGIRLVDFGALDVLAQARVRRSRASNRQLVKRISLRYFMVVASVGSIGHREGSSLVPLMRHCRNRKRSEEDDNKHGSFLSAEVISCGIHYRGFGI
jgi:hypothetical protein